MTFGISKTGSSIFAQNIEYFDMFWSMICLLHLQTSILRHLYYHLGILVYSNSIPLILNLEVNVLIKGIICCYERS